MSNRKIKNRGKQGGQKYPVGPVHIEDVELDAKSGKACAIKLSNGRRLGGVVDLNMRLLPDGRLDMVIRIHAQATIGGQMAVVVMQERAKQVREVRSSPLVGPDGRPLS